MKRTMYICILFPILVVLCSTTIQQQVNALAKAKAELYGSYKNINAKDDYFKRVIFNSTGTFQRTEIDPENPEAPNPTKNVSGTWSLNIESLDLGPQVHFKNPKANGPYADLTFGYYISHDTLFLANTVFGFSDWSRPYVLKKMK